MKASKNTFIKGDKVKVDRSGIGNGIQFLTIDKCFDSNNPNGYKDYSFTELSPTIRVSEFYIRKVSDSDLKVKSLYESLNIENFEIDIDAILETFWKSQKKYIKQATNYINKFLYPYLTEYGHSLPIEKMNNYDANYNYGMNTKNRFIFTIPHDDLNIIVIKNATYATIYITAPQEFSLTLNKALGKKSKIKKNCFKCI